MNIEDEYLEMMKIKDKYKFSKKAIQTYKADLKEKIEKLKIYPLMVGLGEMDDFNNMAVSRKEVLAIIDKAR